MTDTTLTDRITVNPEVCGGRPCVRGHRIWASLVPSLLADGMSVADVLDEYPGLEEADLHACVAYAARLASGPSRTVAW